jgi:N-acetylglucosamine kinase-like BadF-type ATPase
MGYYLGVDVGGTKTAALIADQDGQAVGYGVSGPGNYEGVGWDGFRRAVREAVDRALVRAGLQMGDLRAAGLGIAGYDWPSQRQIHLDALEEIGFDMPLEIVNDAVLGILAGAEQGWGVSVVSGTGCNCRGWSQDHRQEGRVVGGYSHWSGEYAGGFDLLARAMRAVIFEWNRRGPATTLSDLFLEVTGARDLDDLVEGLYVGNYHPWDRNLVLRVFEIARGGDEQALTVLRWAGVQLGEMACGVIRQLELQATEFDIVLIGSIFKGHPTIAETLAETVHKLAPHARLVHLGAQPVMGAVFLGMEQAGLDGYHHRERLVETMELLIAEADRQP